MTTLALVMDLIFSLRTERKALDVIQAQVTAEVDRLTKILNNNVNSLDMRINRIENDRLYK